MLIILAANTVTAVWYPDSNQTIPVYATTGSLGVLAAYPGTPPHIFRLTKGPQLYTPAKLVQDTTAQTMSIQWRTPSPPPNPFWPTSTDIYIVLTMTCTSSDGLFEFKPTAAQTLTLKLTSTIDTPLPDFNAGFKPFVRCDTKEVPTAPVLYPGLTDYTGSTTKTIFSYFSPLIYIISHSSQSKF